MPKSDDDSNRSLPKDSSKDSNPITPYCNVFPEIFRKYPQTDVVKTLEQLIALVKELKKLCPDLYPRECLVREQAMLFAQDLYVKLKVGEFSAGRFREGIENLYFFEQKLAFYDSGATECLNELACKIIRIMENLISQAESLSGLHSINWNAVIVALKRMQAGRKKINKPVVGKFERLQLDKIIGAGGFGAVYKAWLGNSACTVKLVPIDMMPSAKHAIMDKMVASVINHPCLVKYHATFAANTAFVTIMEYIRGVDLSKLLRVVSYLPTIVLRVVIAQLGLAIQHLHLNGFIHRDVKPENMMILPGCRIKLIDFDTAKACIGKFNSKLMPSFYSRTKLEFFTPEMAGTLPYCPPENIAQKGYGRTMDWWALGVVTYQLSVGRLPFEITSVEVLQNQILTASYSWPNDREFDPKTKLLVNDCLRINPKFRLCSKHYGEFQKHAFFENVDWVAIECAPVLIQYDPIMEVYSKELKFKSSLHQELLTPQVAMADFEKGLKLKAAKPKLPKSQSQQSSSGQATQQGKEGSAAAAATATAAAATAAAPAPAAPAAATASKVQQATMSIASQITPTSSPTVEFKRARLFGDMAKIKDLDEQVNMFTYSSWAFSRAMETLERGEMPNSKALLEPVERVVVEDNVDLPYAFEALLAKVEDEVKKT